MAITINQTGLKPRTLYSVKEVPQLPEFAWLTESALRHMIFKSKTAYACNGEVVSSNGMVEAGVIKRFGARILIDIDKLRDWVQGSQNNAMIIE